MARFLETGYLEKRHLEKRHLEKRHLEKTIERSLAKSFEKVWPSKCHGAQV
jgi:hypothetical protein